MKKLLLVLAGIAGTALVLALAVFLLGRAIDEDHKYQDNVRIEHQR